MSLQTVAKYFGAVVLTLGAGVVMGGKLVDAIGGSGGTGAQNEQAAEAGVAALK